MKSVLITPAGSRYEVPAGISGWEAVKSPWLPGAKKIVAKGCLFED